MKKRVIQRGFDDGKLKKNFLNSFFLFKNYLFFYWSIVDLKNYFREFPDSPGLGLSTFIARAWVQLLVEELRSCKLYGIAKKKNKTKNQRIILKLN